MDNISQIPKQNIVVLGILFAILIALGIIIFTPWSNPISERTSEINYNIEDVAKIYYRYDDVPRSPIFMKSYDITITESSIIVNIGETDSPSKTEEYPITFEKFEEALVALETNEIGKFNKNTYSDCAGSTQTLVLTDTENRELFRANVLTCEEGEYGNLSGDYLQFSATLKRLVPNFDTLLNQ